MPIKVRCRGCEKVLNIPDAARGKTVKCPDCGERLKIPAGPQAAAKAAPQAAAKPAPAKKAPARKSTKSEKVDQGLSGEMFVNLNLDHAEDEEQQICPYCAAPLDEDDPVCRNCGMDTETRQMDKKEAKKRSRKGPDTSKFWGEAWSDSWHFILQHKTLPIRTGKYWTQFLFLVFGCYYMAHDYSVKGPPKTFWYAMTLLCVLGIPGWFWTLSMKLIQASIFREEVKPDRIHFDFFQNVAMGLRAVIWPFVVLLPAWMVIGVVWTLGRNDIIAPIDEDTLKLLGGICFGLPFVVFPLATIHMTTKHSHKAWIFADLAVIFGKNFAPCFYWFLQALVVLGPIAGGLAAIQFYGGGLNPFSNEHVGQLLQKIADWFFKLIGEQAKPGDFIYEALRVPLAIGFAFLAITPVAIFAGFPAVFMMRSNALLGYYFQTTLDLVNRIYPGTPAGFWIRFLAYCGDFLMIPLSSVLVLRIKKAVSFAWFVNAVVILSAIFQGTSSYAFQMGLVLFVLYNWWMYFAISESGNIRSTVAKEAFGLMVNTEKHKQLTLKQASMRWFCTIISAATFGLGFVMCAFNPKKKSLHDLLSKSEVVFEGDK